MPTILTDKTHQSARVVDAVRERDTPTSLKRIVMVADPEHDLAWLGGLRTAEFEPILLASNFDAVQMAIANHDLRMVLLAQQSMKMDGIAACQLLRQKRSEEDVAIVLVLNEMLDRAVIEAFAAGVSDVVCQPFHSSELIARLDAAWQRLLVWEDLDVQTPGFLTEQSVSLPDAECSEMRPHFGGPPRTRKSATRTEADAKSESPPQPVETTSVDPEPQARIATRMAGDWLLTHDLPHGIAAPALDLTQLKFVAPLPAHQIESARQRGELSEVLLDRVWVCPQCRALPSFRPACPCCGSAGVERDRTLHHFACAFVGPTSEFQLNEEGLSCPKCCAQRLMVGTDCEYLDGPWRCSDCDWSPTELEIVGHCLKCGFRFPAQQAALEDVIGLSIDQQRLDT